MSGLDFHDSGVRIKMWLTMMDSMTEAVRADWGQRRGALRGFSREFWWHKPWVSEILRAYFGHRKERAGLEEERRG
eukprot:6143149-Pleurochrysis_carterae.AAC.1